MNIPAKINLGLNVVSKRADGYHNLETVFYPVPIYDELTLECVPADEGKGHVELSLGGIEVLGRVEDNLVVRACNLLKADHAVLNDVDIKLHLTKNIPTQAGMGGGSADASYTLLIINETFNLGLATEQLEAYALKLGADCPFFITSKPAFATGVGEELSPINVDLIGKYIAVVKPDIAISTKEAFSKIVPMKPHKCCRDVVAQPIDTWRAELKNDFEVSAFALYPELATIKQRLYDEGAVYAAMSGSGSAMFGIFNEKPQLDYAIVRRL